MKRAVPFVAALLAALTLAVPADAQVSSYPRPPLEAYPRPGPPNVTAASWILYDETMDTVIASHNPDEERAMASITKIMTAVVAIEHGSLDDEVTISARAVATGEKEIDLVAGESLTLRALLKAALIHSANDAATALAEHVGGSVERFVEMMNERAEELGMTDSRFANPHGLDAPSHYTTAADMLTLARYAMSMPAFSEIVRSKIVVMPPSPDGTLRRGTTTNLMLDGYQGTIGIKTGFTSRALLTYVAVAERNGHRLFAVLLGSDGPRAHFTDATELFEYGFRDLSFYGAVAAGTEFLSAKARVSPDPILAGGEIESYVHLAGQGLLLSPPTPPLVSGETVSVPVVESARHGEQPPRSPLELVSYWISLALGR